MNQQPTERPQSDIAKSRSPEEQVGMIRGMLDQFALSWRLLWDERVMVGLKLIPILTVAYLFMPFDVISEVLIPVLGPLVFLDDIGIILLGLNIFNKSAPPDVVKEHLREMGSNLNFGLDSDDDEDIIDVDATPVD